MYINIKHYKYKKYKFNIYIYIFLLDLYPDTALYINLCYKTVTHEEKKILIANA